MNGQSTGSLVGGVIGGIIGLVVPGASVYTAALGVSIGATAGGVAGAIYDNATAPDQVQEQQSLTDQSVTTSTLGSAIPQVFGKFEELGGNVIWQGPLVEHVTETAESASGKGGGPQIITRTKTYTRSVAYAICYTGLTGPMAGLSKVRKNGNVEYDSSTSPSLPDNWVFYPGDDSQLADPTIEAQEGVGNVPAYRKLCYIVITNDPYGYSGQAPNRTFGVYQSTNGTTALGGVAVSPTSGLVWVTVPALKQVWVYDPDTRERLVILQLTNAPITGLTGAISIDSGGIPWCVHQVVPPGYPPTEGVGMAVLEPTAYVVNVSIILPHVGGAFGSYQQPISNIVFADGDSWVAAYEVFTLTLSLYRLTSGGGLTRIAVGTNGGASRLAVTSDDHVWMVSVTDGTLLRIDSGSNTVAATITGLGNPLDVCVSAGDILWVPDQASSNLYRIAASSNTVTNTLTVGTRVERCCVASDGYVWVGCFDGSLCRIHPTTLVIQTYHVEGMVAVEPYYTYLAAGASGAMWAIARLQNTITHMTTAGVSVTLRTGSEPLDICQGDNNTVWVTSVGGGLEQFSDDGGTVQRVGRQVTANGLADVLTKVNNACGISGSHLNVDLVPDGLVNALLPTIQAARACILQLMEAYRFYLVESGLALHYREIGSGGIVFEVEEDDTDWAENQSPGTGVVITRGDGALLPTTVEYTYVEPLQNYQAATQRAQLALTTEDFEQPRVITSNLALDAQTAKQNAEETLNQIHTQRASYQSTFSRKLAYLEPGDRGTVDARGLTHTIVLSETTYGHPGLLQWQAKRDAAFVRGALGAVAGTAAPGEQSMPIAQPTIASLLNLPALNSTDTDPRYHAIYRGLSHPWPGAVLYRSTDGEATYQQIDFAVLEATQGTVASATASHDWHTFDEDTTITVVLAVDGMTLTGVNDAALFANQNLAALCDADTGQVVEVFSFGVATLTGTNTYELSHLLRGRRGTEYGVGLHGTNERFVLLTPSVRPIAMNMDDRDIERDYKSPTLGEDISGVTSFPFTPNAENLILWTTANNHAELSGSDWILTFYARSRLNGPGNEFDGIAFDPDFDFFQVDIFTDNTYTTVKRSTMTDGGNPLDANIQKTWTYDTAMQTADFGSLQATVYYRVYQAGNNRLSHPENLVAA